MPTDRIVRARECSLGMVACSAASHCSSRSRVSCAGVVVGSQDASTVTAWTLTFTWPGETPRLSRPRAHRLTAVFNQDCAIPVKCRYRTCGVRMLTMNRSQVSRGY
ncbi:hypothetical protein [Dactylosporangium sp. CA-139066]|uniref:hypothetical protein n=1 Tax=Dactylosporangium sp. CA-139066 TaxID=3239930 RepID=UPI003D91BCAB